MPCLILLVVVGFPRVALALLFLFSNYLQHAYHGVLAPILGFIFLPLTTLAYAWLVNSGMPIHGFYAFLLILAVILDLSGHGGAYTRRHG